MWLSIILALGFTVLGVLLSPWLKPLGYDRSIERFMRRLRLMYGRPGPKISRTLQIGNLNIPNWIILDGFSRDGIRIETVIAPEEVRLPPDLATLRSQLQKGNDRLKNIGRKTPYNGRKYALAGLHCNRSEDAEEQNICRLTLKHSDYFNFLTIIENLDRELPGETRTIRQKYFEKPRALPNFA